MDEPTVVSVDTASLPKPDITAYELATILAGWLGGFDLTRAKRESFGTAKRHLPETVQEK